MHGVAKTVCLGVTSQFEPGEIRHPVPIDWSLANNRVCCGELSAGGVRSTGVVGSACTGPLPGNLRPLDETAVAVGAESLVSRCSCSTRLGDGALRAP